MNPLIMDGCVNVDTMNPLIMGGRILLWTQVISPRGYIVSDRKIRNLAIIWPEADYHGTPERKWDT